MRFTVIIPVRDDPAGLERALGGLSRQDRRPDEVLVVNSGKVPLATGLSVGIPFREVRIGPATPGSARNAGAAAGKGEWLAFLDAGTEPDSAWLGVFVDAAEAGPEVDALFGSYLPRVQDDWDWAAVAVYVAPSNVVADGRSPTTASICVRRTAWERLGGMREDLRAGEDLLFFEAISSAGLSTAGVPLAQVLWDLPRGPRGHFRRLRTYSCATYPTSLSRRWQRPVLRMYVGGALMATAFLLLYPPLVGLVAVLAGVRLARNVARRRSGLPRPFSLSRVARVPAMLAIADLATLLGVTDAWRGELSERDL